MGPFAPWDRAMWPPRGATHYPSWRLWLALPGMTDHSARTASQSADNPPNDVACSLAAWLLFVLALPVGADDSIISMEICPSGSHGSGARHIAVTSISTQTRVSHVRLSRFCCHFSPISRAKCSIIPCLTPTTINFSGKATF